MPNQYNFRSDITNVTDARFIASRVVRFPDEGVLLEQIPASFGFDVDDNIEFHFYTIPDNTLLLSLVLDNENYSEVLKSHIVSYESDTETSFKNYIRIDFTKLFEVTNSLLLPGEYRIVMNFFSDEIGSYNDKKLYVQEIAADGTEIQLAFNRTTDPIELDRNLTLLREFVEPSFDKPFAVGVSQKIFESGVTLENSSEGLTYENISDNIDTPTANQTMDGTLGRIERIGQAENLKTNLEEFITQILYKSIREKIIINGDERIQQDEFQQFIVDSINEEFGKLPQLGNKIIIE